MTDQRVIAVIVSAGLLLLILELVRRKRLMERYALLWLFSTVLLLVLSIWSGLLNTLASALGISYPPSALFAVAFGVVLVLLVHFSLAISRLSDQNKILAQRLALLQRAVEQHGSDGTPLQDGAREAPGELEEIEHPEPRQRMAPTR
jgi:hypothetical protein